MINRILQFGFTLFLVLTGSIAAEAVDGALNWVYQSTHSQVRRTPAVSAGGTIYIVDSAGNRGVHAVNPDGSTRWVFASNDIVNNSFQDSTPAVGPDGTIFATTVRELFAINPDGTEKWHFTPTGGQDVLQYASPAVAVDGTVYVNGNSRLYAVNPDGTQKWAYFDGHAPYGPPAIGCDGSIYMVSDLMVHALNPDGTRKWDYTPDPRDPQIGGFGACGLLPDFQPAIGADGTVYVTSCHGVVAFHPNGTLRWVHFLGYDPVGTRYSSATSVAIGADGALYLGTGADLLHVINPDGSLRVVMGAGIGAQRGSTPVIRADGSVLVVAAFGNLYAINPDGSYRWLYVASNQGISPTVAPDGTIYFADWNANGDLIAIGGSLGGLAASPWPMLGNNAQHTAQADTLSAPPAPPAMSYVVTGTHIAIAWSTTPCATGYLLNYAPYPFTGLDSIGTFELGNQTSFAADLWPGAAFYIAVQAYNAYGAGGYSNIELFMIGGP